MAGQKKTRTPEHVRADMSLHHIAYIIAKCGFTIESSRADYGFDGSITFFAQNGEVETGNVFIQLKATDNIARFVNSHGISYSIDMRDFRFWFESQFPVYFVVFDATSERAYWVYFQQYAQRNNLDPRNISTASTTIHISPTAIFDLHTIRAWQVDKNNVIAQLPDIRHG